MCTFESTKDIWAEMDQIWGCWVKLRVLTSFENKRNRFEVVWELYTFEGIKAILVEKNLIWVGWVQLAIFESVEGHLSLLRVQRHIWVEKGMM